LNDTTSVAKSGDNSTVPLACTVTEPGPGTGAPADAMMTGCGCLHAGRASKTALTKRKLFKDVPMISSVVILKP
jgi:hypothetical protein